MSEKVSLYNPRDTPPEQLEAMLTGREHLLKEVLDSLREQAGSASRQHWLLRGPRGIGKTHLTGIIHHRVSTDAALSKVYLPLWLGEADVYEVYSPATLLMRIAERLVEAVPGAKMREALIELEGTGDEDALFEELAALLTEEAKRQGRILLVLMENLDALFESFAPKQRTAQTRQLRSLLLDNPSFLFISTTPTRYLQELSNPKAPLFAQLKERRLNQLKVEEVGALFTKLSQVTGRKELLGSGPDALLKQRIIHLLTGGLPRSVVMAFEILRDKEGIQALVEDLRAFLDAQTAYFEARLSRLAPRERAIVTTLALAEQNLTLKEIADKSRLPEKSLSTLVSRLEQEGHVEAAGGVGGKGTLYGLSEGLFRIWYQYRKGRMLLEPLVRFLAYWYEPGELEAVVGAMEDRLQQDGPTAGRAARLAYMQVQAAFRLATSEHGRLERQRIWDECRRQVQHAASSDAEPCLDPALQQAFSEVIELMFSGRTGEGRIALERVLAPHEPLDRQTALGTAQHLIIRAAMAQQERRQWVPELFQWVVERYERSGNPQVRRLVVLACLGLVEGLRNLRRWEEALSWADALLERPEVRDDKEFVGPVLMIVSERLISLEELGRHEEVVISSKGPLELCREHSFLQSTGVLHRLLAALSGALWNLKRYDEQKKVLEELTQLKVPDAGEPARRISEGAAVDLYRLRARMGEQVDRVEFVGALQKVIDGNPEQVLSMPAEVVSVCFAVSGGRVFGGQGKPTPSTGLRSAFLVLLRQDVAKAAAVFLGSAGAFLLLFQLDEVSQWLKQMAEAEIPAEQKQQLLLHLRLVELVSAMAAKAPDAGPQVGQRLGRLPKELQELYAVLATALSRVIG